MNKQSCVLSYVVVKCAPSLLSSVVPLRFEHRLTGPKPVVLPLHQETIVITKQNKNCIIVLKTVRLERTLTDV